MKKCIKILIAIGLSFVGLSALFVFMPATFGAGIIGTYIPSDQEDVTYFSSFTIKANNIVRLTYSETKKTEEYKWYAKCDGEKTSIYFVISSTSEIQLNLLSTRELKDMYHQNDVYRKV